MVAAKKDRYIPRLQKHYNEVVKADLIKKRGYKNTHQVPRLDKIVINMGVGEAVERQQEDQECSGRACA